MLATPLFGGNHFSLFSNHPFSVHISALTEPRMHINVYIGVSMSILQPCKVDFISYCKHIVMSSVTICRHGCL